MMSLLVYFEHGPSLCHQFVNWLSKRYFFTMFNICIRFYRPDLVDWKKVERRQVRERIDLAFHIMEKEYGVTRLLDPEGKSYE